MKDTKGKNVFPCSDDGFSSWSKIIIPKIWPKSPSSSTMGQKQSKQDYDSSPIALLSKDDDHFTSPSIASTRSSPGGGITPPAISREITRFSEILDPREVLQNEIYNVTPTRSKPPTHDRNMPAKPIKGIVQSPSGNALSPEEFLVRPNRPLAIWERQEAIIQGTREAIARHEAENRTGRRSRTSQRSRKKAGSDKKGSGVRTKKQRRCCPCWSFQ